jgi:hypothetical protein
VYGQASGLSLDIENDLHNAGIDIEVECVFGVGTTIG